MRANESDNFTPSSDLLPFGGFEVKVLLLKLQDGHTPEVGSSDALLDFQPQPREVSSGWLRSKLMCDIASYM